MSKDYLEFMGERLKGKNILVTGSGRGFGRSMAVAYASEGSHVIITARKTSELKKTEQHITNVGGEASTIPCDLSKDESLLELARNVEELGGIDVLVNNAATCSWLTIEDMTEENWDKTMSVNLRAPFILSLLFYKEISSRGGGSIINISSSSAQKGFIAELAYCSSKYGLEGLTQCLALELKNYNIAVNSLNVGSPPGYTLKPTSLSEEAASKMPEEIINRYAPVDLMVQHFTNAWTFLALQKGNGITGQRFNSRELSEMLMALGEEEVLKRYHGKLLESVYKPIKFPEKLKYQNPDGGWKEIWFI